MEGLHRLGVQAALLIWITAFFSNWQRAVRIGGSLSDWKTLYASCSFTYYESYWCWRSLALGELCLQGHKIITNPLWIFWPRKWPLIKLKNINLGKPDTQKHYPSKGEGTPAITEGKIKLTGGKGGTNVSDCLVMRGRWPCALLPWLTLPVT